MLFTSSQASNRANTCVNGRPFGWVKEVEIMLKTKTKAEIQALSSYGFQYLSEVYLPLKLQQGDWI